MLCPTLLSTATMLAINTQVDPFLASLPPLKGYGTLGEQQGQHYWALIQKMCAALLMDNTNNVIHTLGGIFLVEPSSWEFAAPRCGIGVWKWGRGLRYASAKSTSCQVSAHVKTWRALGHPRHHT